MIDILHTEDECREYLEELIWHGHPKCPHIVPVPKNRGN